MFALKKFLHGIAIGLTKTFSKLMPDRAPMTFIGAGSTAELCRAIAESGTRKVLVVTDAGLVGLGLVAKVTALLEAAGVECAVYDEVQPDPTFAQVEAGLVRLRAEGCEAVLAIGGGSPMDAAKVISAAATNDRPLARLEGLMKVRKAPMPLYALPTTAGTGSEVTLAAVVSDTDTHTKKFFVDPKLIPLMTALDPELMLGLPAPITAATGMDALTHALESYIAKTSTDQTERYAVAAVRLIFENLPKVYADGSDVEARKAMALASYYAGFAFTRTSVGYVHAIAHHFGAFYGTPHGLANAIVLPHVLEFSADAAAGRLAALARAIGLDAADDAAGARAFIDAVRGLEEVVGIPSTLDALRREDIERIATGALAEAHANYPVPRYMSEQECQAMLARMLAA